MNPIGNDFLLRKRGVEHAALDEQSEPPRPNRTTWPSSCHSFVTAHAGAGRLPPRLAPAAQLDRLKPLIAFYPHVLG